MTAGSAPSGLTGDPLVALLPPAGEGSGHFDGVRGLLAGLRLFDPADDPTGPAGATAQAAATMAGARAARRTAAQEAEHVAADLAREAGPDVPVLLVGAARGGLIARLIAMRTPGPGMPVLRVAGLVLVDSPHEQLTVVMGALTGPPGAAGRRGPDPRPVAPGALGELPLVVLARRGPDPAGSWARTSERLWRVHQRMLLPLSSRSVYQEVPASGRHLCRDRPDVVAGHVRHLVDGAGPAPH